MTTTITRSQLALLAALTLTWGLNWPVMKLGVSDYPALTFRTISIWLGLPVLALGLLALRMPFRVARRDWPALLQLTMFNMLIWHGCIIIAIKGLSSGRAAILAYTMPIFAALIGALFFATAMTRRTWVGVGGASLGVVLLLWHEMTGLAGSPGSVVLALISAASWALGTLLLRRTRIEAPTLTIAFWMTTITAVFMLGLALLLEPLPWTWPTPAVQGAIAYNAVMVFGFAHVAWYTLARKLPPMASSLGVMMIPVLGVFTGALWLGEILHWQDWAAVGLMVVAIGSVLWPSRQAAPPPAAAEATR